MKKASLFLFTLFLSLPTLAGPIQIIRSLGASPKGQFVAIEEYGFNSGLGTYYSRIKLMNVWKKEYVAPVIEIEQGARRPSDLQRVRDLARQRASADMQRYNIVTSS